MRKLAGIVLTSASLVALASSTWAQAPAIISPPESRTALPGDALSLTVVATGAEPLAYAWYRDHRPLTESAPFLGTGTAQLQIANAQSSEQGAYVVVVSNAFGATTSQVAVLNIGTNLITWEAEQGQLTPPMARDSDPRASGGFYVSSPSNGGKITYEVVVPDAGAYLLWCRVLAWDIRSDSFYVSVSGTNLEYDVAQQRGDFWQWRVVTRRVSVNPVVVTEPRVLNLAAGTNLIVFGGRDPHTKLDRLALVPADVPYQPEGSEPPAIVLQPQGAAAVPGGTLSLQVGATGSAPLAYRWRRDGVELADGANVLGAGTAVLTVTNLQPAQAGAYSAVITNAYGAVTSDVAVVTVERPLGFPVIAWGGNNFGQATVPSDLTNAVQIDAGYYFSLALRADGTVAAWGDNTYGQCDVPAGLSGVRAISAGAWHALALGTNGQVVAWGRNEPGYGGTALPDGVNDAMGIAAGWGFNLILRSNGTVVAIGHDVTGETAVPPGLSHVVAIAAGAMHNLALKDDGSVVAWGQNSDGKLDVPPSLTNAVSLSAHYYHSIALTADGRVFSWGRKWSFLTNGQPADLTGAIAVASGGWFTNGFNLAARADSTVVGWGDNGFGQISIPSGLTNVMALAAGWQHSLALVRVASPHLKSQPRSQTVLIGDRVSFQVEAGGAPELTYQWRHNGQPLGFGGPVIGSRDATLVLLAATSDDAGRYDVVVRNPHGSVISAAATLTVLAAPQIVSAPQPMMTCERGEVSFEVRAIGPVPYGYAWFKDGVPVTNGGDHWGADSARLTLFEVTAADAGLYSVTVSNIHGATQSAPAALTVLAGLPLPEALDAPEITWILPPPSVSAELYGQCDVTHDGVDAARFVIYADSAIGLESLVTGPGTLSFWWNLDLPFADYGSFSLWVDGTRVAGRDWNRNPGWRFETIPLGSGVHTCRWDCAIDIGGGSGWLDEVKFYPTGERPLLWEAEAGTLTSPMTTGTDPRAFGGTYVATPTKDQGRIDWLLDIPVAGDYIAWCRFRAYDGTADSFFVSADDETTRDIFDMAELYGRGDFWRWTNVMRRLSTPPPPPVPQEVRTFSFSAGLHLLHFYGRDIQARLDRLLLTTNRNFVPIPPVIAVVPMTIVTNRGAVVSLAVAATGSETLQYHWRFNGAPIPEATGSRLELADVQPAQSGIYAVTVSNLFGWVTTQMVLTVNLDFPTVDLQSPAPGSIFPAQTDIALAAHAADTNGTITQVDFYANEQLLGTVLDPPYELVWSNVPAGAFTVQARAHDNDGNLGASLPTPIFVGDTTNPPVVMITQPANGRQAGVGATLLLEAWVTDADGIVARVDFYADGQVVGSAKANPFTAPWIDIPAGQHILTAIATDNSGLTATSAPVTLNVSRPQVHLVLESPTNGSVFVNPPEVTLYALAEAVQDPIRWVEFRDGTQVLGTVTNAPYRLSWAHPAEGLHALVAIAYDGLGAAGTSSPPALVTISGNPTNAPQFAWSQPALKMAEDAGVLTLIVTNRANALAATVQVSIVPGSAGESDLLDAAPQTVAFVDGQLSRTVTLALRDDAVSESDEFFLVRLSDPSQGQVTGDPDAIVWIHDNDTNNEDSLTAIVRPPLPPSLLGALQIDLSPPEARGQWRFAWESEWRDRGTLAAHLPSGNYRVEFKPAAGRQEPLATVLPVLAGVTNPYTFSYVTNASLLGSLMVLLEPPLLATNAVAALRAQWQLEGETAWHDSGESLHALPADSYTVRFKALSNWWAPPRRIVSVGGNRDNRVSARYYVADESPGAPPLPLDFQSDITQSYQAGLPYACAGQLLSAMGWASGFVVKERTVLTAAHAVFDDSTLAFVPEVKWFFQRHAGAYEPAPQLARGWFVLSGYAAQRQADASPGLASVASQNLDVAALYFLAPAGRGGYGGYLVSQSVAGEWLLRSRLHTLVGYPVDMIPTGDQGKLHATVVRQVDFQQLSGEVFATTTIKSYPGNSGGPLCVLGETNALYPGGVFYPAGICLGGSQRTVVRTIDREVARLINQAEQSSHENSQGTGGGPLLFREDAQFSPWIYGFTEILLGPEGGAYRFLQDTNLTIYTQASNRFAFFAHAPYDLEFLPLPGYLAPEPRVLRLDAGQTARIDGRYRAWGSNRLDLATGALWAYGSSGSVYRLEYAETLPPSNGWTVVGRVTLTNQAQVVTPDLTAPNPGSPSGYYRTVLEP